MEGFAKFGQTTPLQSTGFGLFGSTTPATGSTAPVTFGFAGSATSSATFGTTTPAISFGAPSSGSTAPAVAFGAPSSGSTAPAATFGAPSSGALSFGFAIPSTGGGFTPTAAEVVPAKRKQLQKLPDFSLQQVPVGNVYVHGSGECDQLGLGDNQRERKKPTIVKPLSGKGICDIAVGALHVVCVAAGGILYSWGCNDDGALGRASDSDTDCLPGRVAMPSGVAVRKVSAGDNHSCALDNLGRVWLWGTYKDSNGHIGIARKRKLESAIAEKSHEPAVVLEGCKEIASGANHTLALAAEPSTKVFSWGSNATGQLGLQSCAGCGFKELVLDLPPAGKPVESLVARQGGGSEVDGQRVVRIREASGVERSADKSGPDKLRQSIAAGATALILEIPERDVPKPERQALLTPQEVDLPVDRPVVGIYASAECTFIVLDGGAVYGCGLNGDGQVGVGFASLAVVSLQPLAGLDGASWLGGGLKASAALLGGGVLTWGKADECGHGLGPGQPPVLQPRPVAGLPAIRTLRCGGSHTLACSTAGDVFAWGCGLTHQLANRPRDTDKPKVDAEDEPEDELKPYCISSKQLETRFVLLADGGAQHSAELAWSGEYETLGVPAPEEEVTEDTQAALKADEDSVALPPVKQRRVEAEQAVPPPEEPQEAAKPAAAGEAAQQEAAKPPVSDSAAGDEAAVPVLEAPTMWFTAAQDAGDKWRCEVCACTWDLKEIKCKACESWRPGLSEEEVAEIKAKEERERQSVIALFRSSSGAPPATTTAPAGGTAAPVFGFGAASGAPPATTSAPAGGTAAPVFGFGAASAAQPAAAAPPVFGFGGPAATTPAAAAPPVFGSSSAGGSAAEPAAAAAPVFGFGFGGATSAGGPAAAEPAAAAPPVFGFGGAASTGGSGTAVPAAAAAPVFGFGGAASAGGVPQRPPVFGVGTGTTRGTGFRRFLQGFSACQDDACQGCEADIGLQPASGGTPPPPVFGLSANETAGTSAPPPIFGLGASETTGANSSSTTTFGFGSGSVDSTAFRPTLAPPNTQEPELPPRNVDRPNFGTEEVPLGDIFVHGSGECDQLGLGDSQRERKKPTLIKRLLGSQIVDVAVGALHAVVVTAGGHLFSWGCNDDGALGRTSDNNADAEPHPVAMPVGVAVRRVSCGDNHTCALDSRGRVWLWGTYKDSNGHIGIARKRKQQGTICDKSSEPSVVLEGCSQIASGANHTLALSSDTPGRVYAWGSNGTGQLGLSSAAGCGLQERIVEVTGGDAPQGLKACSSGGVEVDGLRVVRLRNANGTESSASSMKLASVHQAISAGARTLILEVPEREVSKQEKQGLLHPQEMDVGDVNSTVSGIFASADCTFITAENGDAYGCGLNGDGQVGLGFASLAVPTLRRVNGVREASWLGGCLHSSAALAEGRVLTWGKADECGLGMSSTASPVMQPKQVPGLPAVRTLRCGGSHMLACSDDGAVFAWGCGLTYQLGNRPRDSAKPSDADEDPEDELRPYRLSSKQLEKRFVLLADGGAQHSLELAWAGSYAPLSALPPGTVEEATPQTADEDAAEPPAKRRAVEPTPAVAEARPRATLDASSSAAPGAEPAPEQVAPDPPGPTGAMSKPSTEAGRALDVGKALEAAKRAEAARAMDARKNVEAAKRAEAEVLRLFVGPVFSEAGFGTLITSDREDAWTPGPVLWSSHEPVEQAEAAR